MKPIVVHTALAMGLGKNCVNVRLNVSGMLAASATEHIRGWRRTLDIMVRSLPHPFSAVREQ